MAWLLQPVGKPRPFPGYAPGAAASIYFCDNVAKLTAVRGAPILPSFRWPLLSQRPLPKQGKPWRQEGTGASFSLTVEVLRNFGSTKASASAGALLLSRLPSLSAVAPSLAAVVAGGLAAA